MPNATERAKRARRAGYIVRPAEKSDAEALGEIHVAVWRATYVGLLSADYLMGMRPSERAGAWRRSLSEAADDVTNIVAEAPDGEVVGFAVAGPSREDAPAIPDELYAMNVLPTHQGSGVADLLMEESIGSSPRELWVVVGNDRAIAFYQRHGFRPDGAEKDDPRFDAHEMRMIRR